MTMDASARDDGIRLSVPTYQAYCREIRAGRKQNAMAIGRVSLDMVNADVERVKKGWAPIMVAAERVAEDKPKLANRPYHRVNKNTARNSHGSNAAEQWVIEFLGDARIRMAHLHLDRGQLADLIGIGKSTLSACFARTGYLSEGMRDRIDVALTNAETARRAA